MPVIYLRHDTHGEKVAFSDVEATADRENGWVDFDPTAPQVEQEDSQDDEEQVPPAPPVPSFLAPAETPTPPPVVESDLPEDFPGRADLIAAGFTTWDSVVDLDREELIAIKGIGPKTADAILEKMNG